MLEYGPVYYQSSRIYGVYLDALGAEMDLLRQGINEILDQFFVSTSTWGLERWEEELGLTSYAGKPDDFRRSRVISKLRGIGTITIGMVDKVAESYVYSDVNIINHPDSYSFTVKFVDIRGVPPNLNDLKAAIEEIKPAHLEVVYEFTYTTWGEVVELTWEAVKTGGSWEVLKSKQIV